MRHTRRCTSRVGLLLGLLTLLTATGPSPASGMPPQWCEPSEAIRPQLEAIDPWETECVPGQQCWLDQLQVARTLLEAFPDDLFVNRTYQDLVRAVGRDDPRALARLREEYEAHAAENPGDAVAQYLAGRIAENADAERKYYERALAAAPNFPWAHRGLVVVEARENERASRDQRLMRRELESFMKLCPTQLAAALQLASLIEDVPFWQEHVEGLRAALRMARPREQVRAWPLLWSLEFRIAPLAEHPQLREQVARDLKAIEDLHLTDDPRWWSTRSEGLGLTGDVEGKRRLDVELAEKHPCGRLAVEATFEKWMADHPPPAEAASEEQTSASAKAYYDATSEWLARCPDEIMFWFARLYAIQQRNDLPNDAVRPDLDRALEVWERSKALVKMAESPYVQVARLFLERGLEVDRVPSLIEQEIELHRESREGLKTFPVEKQRQEMLVRDSIQLARLRVLAGRAQLALQRTDAARKHLDDAAAELEAVRAQAGETARLAALLKDAEAELWEQRAGLAVAEGHLSDACAMLLKASAMSPERNELAEKAKALWLQAGGTPDGWTVLTTAAQAKPERVTVAAEQGGWERSSTTLKPFKLQALDGRWWTPRDLRGKVAFINVWATWCGPCREELRHLQKLHQRLEGKKNVVLLTLNVDRDVGLIAPFMAENNYAFPVLLAEAYVADLWNDSLSIPRSWIVDRSGVVRYEETGFNPKAAEEWLERVVALMDQMGREKPSR